MTRTITPHKGGRTARLNLRVTPEFAEKIRIAAMLQNETVADYIIRTMEDEMTKKQYEQAQDNLDRLERESVQAMRAGNQAELDRISEQAAKELAKVADYKANK